jgi:triacylglycerol lipase
LLSIDPLYFWLFGALIAFLATLVVVAYLWPRKRAIDLTPEARHPYRTRYPVILLHGIMGWDALKLGSHSVHYFRGVPDYLSGLGAQLHVPRVSPLGAIADRAAALKTFIDSLDCERINIVAHSMGGLDARYAISKLGLAPKVHSLTTVGTPHHGTPIADVGSSTGTRIGLYRALTAMGVDSAAVLDLTTAKMKGFNDIVHDDARVKYGCYACKTRVRSVHPLLLPSHLYLLRRAGPNDGLVPLASQKWGEVYGEVVADHWAQVGWSLRFDARDFYADIFRELTKRGC